MSKTAKKKKVYKLYELPMRRGVILKGFEVNGVEQDVLFSHIDGAYSYCVAQETKDVVHLSASTEFVKETEGIYLYHKNKGTAWTK